MVLRNGGTLYIDEGKPVPALVGETVRNLREIAPTVYFNVPKGFEEIANALEVDAPLRERFFSRVKMMFFAGAGCRRGCGITSTAMPKPPSGNASA
jgi:feruloyl-CoA synthase